MRHARDKASHASFYSPSVDRARYQRLLGAAVAVALASGVAAAFAPGAPTGSAVADVVWKVLFAASMTLAACYADRWTWVVAATVATVAAVGGDAAVVAVGLAALAVAIYATVRHERLPLVGAIAVAGAVQVLLRLPTVGFLGATALLAAGAWAVVVVSALVRIGGPARRRVRRVALWAGAVALVALVPAGIAAAITSRRADAAVEASYAWIDAARRADQPEAIAHLERARRSFGDIATATGGWWSWPARAVPIVGQQFETVHTVADSGKRISDAAFAAAQVTTVEDLRLREGQLDLDEVAALDRPLRATNHELASAQQRLGALHTTWLLPALQNRVDEFARHVDDAADDTELAVDALEVTPSLLGRDGPRTYIVLFPSPAETRELGGFVGNIGVLTADNGRVTLDEVLRARDLNAQTGSLSPEHLAAIEEAGYPARYLAYTPWAYWQNITGTPDFPTVARMVRDISADRFGRPIDGVMYIDPVGLGALLELIGDITIEGLDAPISPDNVATFLLQEQYVEFPEVDERADFLERIARATFEYLTSAQLPGPTAIGDAMGPAVAAGHVRMWTFAPHEEAFLDRMHMTGRFPSATDVAADGDQGWAPARLEPSDELLVTVANANPNKIDAYLHRSVRYDVDVDPASGRLTGTVTVVLRNEAPTDLSSYVIGNANGDPWASNRTFLSIYSGLRVLGATVDGIPIELERHVEYGEQRAATFVTVRTGTSVEVSFTVEGVVRTSDGYRLRVDRPALAHPDEVDVTLRWAGEPAGAPEVRGTLVAPPSPQEGGAGLRMAGPADVWFPPP